MADQTPLPSHLKLTSEEKQRYQTIFSSEYVIETVLKEFSGGITADTTSACNAKCSFCAYKHNSDPKLLMDVPTFQKTIDQANQMGYLGTVNFTPVAGDPLVNPNLFEFIHYAQSRKVQCIVFTTNGILLKKSENYKKLIDEKISVVHISIQCDFDRDTYKHIYGVDKLDDVIDGLELLADYKDRSAKKDTKITLLTTHPPKGEKFWSNKYWQRLLPYLAKEVFYVCWTPTFKKLMEHVTDTSTDSKNLFGPDKQHSVDNWSGVIKEGSIPKDWELREASHTTDSPPCWRILKDLSVLSNGDVRLCSCRYKNTVRDELVIGNINESTLNEIYYGPKHRAIITGIAAGEWPEACRDCSMYEAMTYSEERCSTLMQLAKDNVESAIPHSTISDRDQLPSALVSLRVASNHLCAGNIQSAEREIEMSKSYLSRQLSISDPRQEVIAISDALSECSRLIESVKSMQPGPSDTTSFQKSKESLVIIEN